MSHRIGPPTGITMAPSDIWYNWCVQCHVCGDYSVWNARADGARYLRSHMRNNCRPWGVW